MHKIASLPEPSRAFCSLAREVWAGICSKIDPKTDSVLEAPGEAKGSQKDTKRGLNLEPVTPRDPGHQKDTEMEPTFVDFGPFWLRIGSIFG